MDWHNNGWLAWPLGLATFMLLMVAWDTRAVWRAVSSWRTLFARAFLGITAILYGVAWWAAYAVRASGCAAQVNQFIAAHRDTIALVPTFPACGRSYDHAMTLLVHSVTAIAITAFITWALAGLQHSRSLHRFARPDGG